MLSTSNIGQLAKRDGGRRLPLQVLHSAAGYYLGTANEDDPISRESAEYFPTAVAASLALSTGAWTQRVHS